MKHIKKFESEEYDKFWKDTEPNLEEDENELPGQLSTVPDKKYGKYAIEILIDNIGILQRKNKDPKCVNNIKSIMEWAEIVKKEQEID